MYSKKRLKAVICMGAGSSQIIVIKKAKQIGYKVIAIDRNSKSPGFEYVDERIVLSTYEADPIIEQLKSMEKIYDIIGVLNRSSGVPSVTTALINRALKLPGVPIESAKTIINKDKLMKFCLEENINSPKCESISSIDDIKHHTINYPCVVKPSISLVGKSGVKKVENHEELKEAIASAIELSMNKVVNIEEYIEGFDISLMSIVIKGKLIPLTILDEINQVNKYGEIFGVGVSIPSKTVGTEIENKIYEIAQLIIKKLGINTSPFLMSCRITEKGEIKLIEVHLDLGGDLVLDQLIPNSTDEDVLSIIINNLIKRSNKEINITFNPTAIIYEKGNILVSKKKFNILKSSTSHELQSIIQDEISKQYFR